MQGIVISERKTEDKTMKTNGGYLSLIDCLKTDMLRPLRLVDEAIADDAQEIRLYAGRPVMILCRDRAYFPDSGGKTGRIPPEDCLTLSGRELQSVFSMLCDYSVFSFQNEIKEGYITLKSGHRAGICGTAVTENGGIRTIREISSINLRIAKQVYGCADGLIGLLRSDFDSLILAGPPGCGKTTILRDAVRQLCSGALGRYVRTGVVDERCEIASCANAEPGFDMGISCDILSGYPKHIGIEHAVRSLSSEIVVCDEICSAEEVSAIEQGMNSGAKFIVTAHAGSLRELKIRPVVRRLIGTGVFKRIVLLKSRATPGETAAIYSVDDVGGII